MADNSGAIDSKKTTTSKKKKIRPVFRRVATAQPGPRVSGALGFPIPGGGFLLFGGYKEEGEGPSMKRTAINETWKLDAELSRWEKVSSSSSSATPRARLASAGAVASGSAWLLGGWDPGSKGDGGEILSDVWRFDLAKGQWSEAELRQPEEEAGAAAAEEAKEEKKNAVASAASASASASASAAAPSPPPPPPSAAPFLPPPPETAVALPPGEDPSAFASLAAADTEQQDLPESIVLPSLPACSRAAAAAIAREGNDDKTATTIALFTHRNGGDILLLDASDVSLPVLRACVVAGDEQAARNKAERAFDGSTSLPASRGLSALAAFKNGSNASSSLHLFGGAPKSGPMLDDSWFLELAPGWEERLKKNGSAGEEKARDGPTLRWSRQASSSSSSSSSNSSPPPRCSQAVGVLSEGSLYLFGGAYYDPAGLLPLGDLWRLDLETREWEKWSCRVRRALLLLPTTLLLLLRRPLLPATPRPLVSSTSPAARKVC